MLIPLSLLNKTILKIISSRWNMTSPFVYLLFNMFVSVFLIVNDYTEMSIYMVASKCSKDHFIAEKCKTVQSFSYISFEVYPLCKYASLPATEEVLEAFLLKPFQFVRRIRNYSYVGSITKASSLQCWFQSMEQVNISCIQVRRVWKMLECCHTALR
jgi:hypothetical protein